MIFKQDLYNRVHEKALKKVNLILQLLGSHARGLECIAFIWKRTSFPSLSVFSSYKKTSLQLHQQAGRHDGTDQSRQALALLQEPTGRPCLQLRFLATAHSLDEPVILLFNVGAAKVCGPGVADGELMELQHVHDSHLSHGAAKQLRTLVHAGRCGGGGVSQYVAC